MKTGTAPIRLILRKATPADEINGDLEIHLEGDAGWAIAPRFNRAIHAVKVESHRGEGTAEIWILTVQFTPDAWYPPELQSATFTVELGSGKGSFHGIIGEVVVSGDAERLEPPPLGEGILFLTCQQFLTTGRNDFRDLRLELPVGTTISSGRAVTLHEGWPLAGAEVVSASFDGKILSARVVVSHPPVADLSEGARRIEMTLEAERRGGLLRGRWQREDDRSEGEIWGELRVTPKAWDRQFISPGMIVGAEDIAGAKARIATGGQWASAADLLRDRAESWRAWAPRPHARPVFIHWSEPGPVRDLKEDCEAAWGNALLAALDFGKEHAAATNRIIRGWATTFTGIPDIGGHLSTSYCFPAMVWAADLLRSCGGLDSEVDAAFRHCLEEVVRPIACTELHFNNWATWANHLEICIAVYCQRGDWFDLALDRYRVLLERYTHSPSGITSETARDLIHAQMGLAPMIATCEVAWRQGVDLYGERQMRLRAAVELHGPFALGHLDDWPLQSSAREVGMVWPMYELAVHHYRGRLGVEMPRSSAVLEATRPEGFNRIGWGTLLCPWEGEASRRDEREEVGPRARYRFNDSACT